MLLNHVQQRPPNKPNMINIINTIKKTLYTIYTHIYSLSMMVPVFVLPMVVSQNATLTVSALDFNIGGTSTATVFSTSTLASTTLIEDTRAVRIDAYFAKNNLPLTGYGSAFVATADKYNLDWRLLPAIAMRESTGGKNVCPYGNVYNVFGWASCKVKFKSYEHAIDSVGAHLAGEIKSTASYYKDKTIPQKLKRYNSVIPSYTKDIYSIMDKIDDMELAMN
jgi:hypothetical protein